jgi:hypothetical protein
MKKHLKPINHRNTASCISMATVKQHTADMPSCHTQATVKQHTADMQRTYSPEVVKQHTADMQHGHTLVSAFCFAICRRVCSTLRCSLFEQIRFAFSAAGYSS